MLTLDELRGFFAASPVLRELGVRPLAVQPGRRLSFTEAEVCGEVADGTRTLVTKASATMALVAKDD
jgi:hypothetical protein